MTKELTVLTPLRAVRMKCLDCSGGSAVEVRECHITACALHGYRMGKRPATVERQQQRKQNGQPKHA